VMREDIFLEATTEGSASRFGLCHQGRASHQVQRGCDVPQREPDARGIPGRQFSSWATATSAGERGPIRRALFCPPLAWILPIGWLRAFPDGRAGSDQAGSY
jgi:hypothetical protein